LPQGVATESVVGGYRYLYEPENATPIRHFSLSARPVITVAKVRISFYSDESAVIRSRGEGRLANATDYALSPASTLWSILHRIDDDTVWRDQAKQRNAPPRLYNADELHYPDSLADPDTFRSFNSKARRIQRSGKRLPIASPTTSCPGRPKILNSRRDPMNMERPVFAAISSTAPCSFAPPWRIALPH
jgi:hypothetical protein